MCPHFTTSRFIKIRKWIQHMTFSMKDGSSSDNYPDKSSRRVRHGKGGCTSKRKKGGCVARTPVSTSPAGGYSALLDVHSAQTHYMLFPLGEWHPRHWGAFQAGLSTRCFTTRSQLNLAAFAAMWLMWLHCRPRLPIEILWTFYQH